MYDVRPSTKFQKDVKRIKKRGYDVSLLTDGMPHYSRLDFNLRSKSKRTISLSYTDRDA